MTKGHHFPLITVTGASLTFDVLDSVVQLVEE